MLQICSFVRVELLKYRLHKRPNTSIQFKELKAQTTQLFYCSSRGFQNHCISLVDEYKGHRNLNAEKLAARWRYCEKYPNIKLLETFEN